MQPVLLGDNEKIRTMVKAAKLKFKSLNDDIKPLKPIYLSDPHITIARSMTYTQFDLAEAEWEKENLHQVSMHTMSDSLKDR